MSLKRLVSFTALAAMGVLAVGAPTALAGHEDDTMTVLPVGSACVLPPLATAGTAVTGGENGVNSPSYDGLADLFDTDPGHFNFDGTAACVGLDIGHEAEGNATLPDTDVVATLVNIYACGDYDNLIGGSGTANGDAVLTADGIEIHTEFGITFLAGVGYLSYVVDADATSTTAVQGQIPTTPDGGESFDGCDEERLYGPLGHSHVSNGIDPNPLDANADPTQIDGGNGLGVIHIAPAAFDDDDPPPPLGGGTSTFNIEEFFVSGAFGGSLSGEGADEDDGPEESDSDL